ncbi:hypothetical protein WG82_21730 [Citrobacter amalonaticus]|uniref:hypothetical protein n=1 Tax=Citrobacter portucalensis TaxID=1639133 RepID=UPI00061ABBFA|nr:hypothetical protein WG82_21730 [Citrobacter amalonaticus]
MNTTILWFILPLMVMLALFFRVIKANSPQSPFIRTLREAGIRPGETEHLGSAWKTESMVTPVFATPILTTSWLA